MKRWSRLFAALLLATALPALAQEEMPAVDTEMPALPDAEMPALPVDVPIEAPTAPGAAAQAPAGAGTTVVGEREAPIGLYIMPWRQSQAAEGLDRPARLLDVELRPLDPEVFRRQVEYHRALSEHLARTGRATP